MEIKNIHWKQEAIDNLKDVLVQNQRQGRKTPAHEIIESIDKNVLYIKDTPFRGYMELALTREHKPKRIFSYHIDKQIKILYYTEKDSLYIVDFMMDKVK